MRGGTTTAASAAIVLIATAAACWPGATAASAYVGQGPHEIDLGPLMGEDDPDPHPLGTDVLGRDILVRVLYAGRWPLSVALAVAVIGSLALVLARRRNWLALAWATGAAVLVADLWFASWVLDPPTLTWGLMFDQATGRSLVEAAAPFVLSTLATLALLAVGAWLQERRWAGEGGPPRAALT